MTDPSRAMTPIRKFKPDPKLRAKVAEAYDRLGEILEIQ